MEQTDPRKLLIEITSILDSLEIPYLVTGGMAVFVWGRPRFTADIDMVIELPLQKASVLHAALKALSDAGYIDADAVKDAIRDRGEFNFIDGATGMKVDFWISYDDAFDRSRMKRRVGKNILDTVVYFSSPEDLILSKLRWYAESRSSRHVEDIQSILVISGKDLDKRYLTEWIERLEYGKFLQEAGIVI